MVAIAGQIADRHLGIRDGCLDHRFDIVGVHWHPVFLPSSVRIARVSPRWHPKLSADTLLRHAFPHYIPDPIVAKPLVSYRAITTG
jgi:hypothetical protein